MLMLNDLPTGGSIQFRQSVWNDRALRVRNGLLASAAIIGSIGFARTRKSRGCRFYRPPPFAEFFFSGSY